MRIREENRNVFLLTMVALCCAVVAGTLALVEPIWGHVPEKQVAVGRPVDAPAQAPIRVVGGTPFVPNVNPRER